MLVCVCDDNNVRVCLCINLIVLLLLLDFSQMHYVMWSFKLDVYNKLVFKFFFFFLFPTNSPVMS